MTCRNLLRAMSAGILLLAFAACGAESTTPSTPPPAPPPPPPPAPVPRGIVDLGIITSVLVAEDSLRPADPGCTYPWEFDIGPEPCRIYRVTAPSAGTVTASLSWDPTAEMSLLNWRVGEYRNALVAPLISTYRVAGGEWLIISVGLAHALGNPAARVYQLTFSFAPEN